MGCSRDFASIVLTGYKRSLVFGHIKIMVILSILVDLNDTIVTMVLVLLLQTKDKRNPGCH